MWLYYLIHFQRKFICVVKIVISYLIVNSYLKSSKLSLYAFIPLCLPYIFIEMQLFFNKDIRFHLDQNCTWQALSCLDTECVRVCMCEGHLQGHVNTQLVWVGPLLLLFSAWTKPFLHFLQLLPEDQPPHSYVLLFKIPSFQLIRIHPLATL